jgi:hypothetical protein
MNCRKRPSKANHISPKCEWPSGLFTVSVYAFDLFDTHLKVSTNYYYHDCLSHPENSKNGLSHSFLSVNQIPVIDTLKSCYFLRRICRILHKQSLSCSLKKWSSQIKRTLIRHSLYCTVHDLIRAPLKLQCQSKTVMVCTFLAGWFDSTIRCVSFYGAP